MATMILMGISTIAHLPHISYSQCMRACAISDDVCVNMEERRWHAKNGGVENAHIDNKRANNKSSNGDRYLFDGFEESF